MPTVKKQNTKPQRNLKTKRKGVVGRIAPIGLGDAIIRMNIYGRSGTGKTTLACTFPKPLLLIGTEDGTKSVHNVKGVDFVRVYNSQELTEVTEHLTTGAYKTCVLDSASGLQDLILKEILGLDELPAQKSWGMASREQYGQCSLQTKERLRALLSLQCNVVILAQEREFNTEGEGELLMPFVASALTPSITGWLNPACDYIAQTFIRSAVIEKKTKIGKKVVRTQQKTSAVEYCLRTAPNPVYTTKFRVPKGSPLPEVIIDPDFDKIYHIIQG